MIASNLPFRLLFLWVCAFTLDFAPLSTTHSQPPNDVRSEAEAMYEPGLRVVFESRDDSSLARADVLVRPNLALHVSDGNSPTPFLSPGPFESFWSGSLNVDIRSRYQFQVELKGELKLEINDASVLNVKGDGEKIPPSDLVRLSKGANVIRLSFRAPSSGDAWFRLHWIPRNGLPSPIPASSLSHARDRELQEANRLRTGRSLFIEHRCAKCHAFESVNEPILELAMDAPSFEGIGSRRRTGWMAEWILNPKAHRVSATMPRMLKGLDAPENARSIALFLATRTTPSRTLPTESYTRDQIDSGERLFNTLHCAACHVVPGAEPSNETTLTLDHINRKFPKSRLVEFLQKPEAHFAWIRMPDFGLNEQEARFLSAFLRSKAALSGPATPPGSARAIETGRQLIQTRGCLNCHSLPVENHFSAPRLKDIARAGLASGCLAGESDKDSTSPVFEFTATEREAIQAFLTTDLTSLTRNVASDFAERNLRNLRCADCHGKFDGFPSIEILGGKLKPEWAERFIAGDISYKPRSWIPARMPAFGNYAKGVARGMAALHGFSATSAAELEIDDKAAAMGRRLVAADGGFSCISCHSIGTIGATAVFESPGINFVYSADRLLKPYFSRWILNPLKIDPTSKMPVYFDEQGLSPLIDIYDGNGAKQIDAIWEYIRLREDMPPPPGLAPAD